MTSSVIRPRSRFEFRRGTSDEWAEINSVLGDGEPGLETDTGKLKIGDGDTHWNDLGYIIVGEALGNFQPLSTNLTDLSEVPATIFGRGLLTLVDVDALNDLIITNTSIYSALARNPDMLITGTIVRNGNGAPTSAPVTWPDGTTGVYTSLVLSSTFLGAVDSYRITYGSSATYTQPTITRESTGAAINVPAIVVT